MHSVEFAGSNCANTASKDARLRQVTCVLRLCDEWFVNSLYLKKNDWVSVNKRKEKYCEFHHCNTSRRFQFYQRNKS
jgi:hypothetical protein